MARRLPLLRRQSSRQLIGPSVEDLLGDEAEPWSPVYIRGRIFDVEEVLHFKSLWLRVGVIWLLVLTPAVLAVAIVSYLEFWEFRHAAYLYAATLVSGLAAPVLVYRQYKRTRGLRLAVRRLRYLHRQKLVEEGEASAGLGGSALSHQKRYRDEIQDVVEQYRAEARRNRRTHNLFQTIIIVGSVGASAITTASVSYGQARWFAVAITATVGLSAGFTGYYKFHERSFSSRQAADSIEREYEAVELRVGRYLHKNEEEAYALFADTVERLRDEHDKRQQQLDQHMEVKRPET